MEDKREILAVVVEALTFTHEEFLALARLAQTQEGYVTQLMEEGLIEPSKEGLWPGRALVRLLEASRLASELDIGIEAASIIASLVQEITRLKAKLARLGEEDAAR